MPWIRQVCDALAYLHNQTPPVIHRDIKPANIRVTPQGKAVLVDFGIAKQQVGGQATTTGAKAVSPGYSPPEQYTGGTTVRSDIYAFGATLYTLLTGLMLPESIQRIISQSGGAPAVVKPPHMVRPGIQQNVSNAIMRAIRPDPGQRFSSIGEFQAALFGLPGQRPAGQPAAAPTHTPTVVGPPPGISTSAGSQAAQPVRQPLPRHGQQAKPASAPSRWIIGGAVVLILFLVTAGIFFASQYGSPRVVATATTGPASSAGSGTNPTAIAGVTVASGSTPASTNQSPTATMAPASPTHTSAQSAPSAPTNTPDPASLNGVNVTSESSAARGIRVEILYADGTPKKDNWIAIHKQTVDVSNNPLAGEPVASQRTDQSGATFFELPPDTYALEIGDLTGYAWGNPFNYEVKSGSTTVVRVSLGRLVVGLRNASGQPLTDRWVAVSVQQKDLLGNPVVGDRISSERTNDAGMAAFDLTSGLYSVQIGDIIGERWGEELNHAIQPMQTSQILVTTGKLVVGVVNADGQPVENVSVGVNYQRQDVTGNAVLGDRIIYGRTNNTGAVSWDITAGTYGVQIGDLNGNPWGSELNHVVNSGEKTTILVELGRLTVGLKDANGSPITGRWVMIHYQKKDVNGNFSKGERITSNYTDNAGLVSFQLTAGNYVVEINDINTLMDVPVDSRKTTFTDGSKTEIR
jgi:serine/threonine protein kinase